jgi:xylulokinase
MFAIGLDIGTTSTIGILIELPDRVAAIASRPATLSAPHPGWAEADPRQWWHNVCEICRELLAADPRARAALTGIGVAGMLPALVLLDAHGAPLRPSIQQSDARCDAELAQLRATADPASFLARTGNGLNQQVAAPKLHWLAKHEPDVLAQARTLTGSYDYISARLTGRPTAERNWALEAGFLDLHTGQVADDLVALAGIAPALLPPVREGHARLGEVTAEAAEATGLPVGLPVIAGSADHIASAHAAGLVAEGDVLLKFGGSADILMASAHAKPDERLYLDYHSIPGLYVPNGCMASGGSMLNWLAALLAPGEDKPHQRLDRLAGALPAGSAGVAVLPYPLGEKSPLHDPLARATVSGLSLNHGAGHIWRATMESVGYALRHHAEVFREIGHPIHRLLASDGGSKSLVWMQMMADIFQMPVRVLTDHPGSCLGAAWLAAIGTGASTDWHGVTNFVGAGRVLEPNAANGDAYDACYARFRSLYGQLQPWFAEKA